MEFEMENYKLRATEKGTIERFWKGGENTRKPDRWKELIGNKIRSGYIRITLYLTSGKRRFLAHRLVYFAHHQHWDIDDTKQQIDHEDRDKTNNKIGNLRRVTNQENHFNTNAKGYCWNNFHQKFQAYISLDGKKKHLGYFEKEEDARQAYLDAKEKYHIIA